MKKLSLMILFISLVSGAAQASEYLSSGQAILGGQSLVSPDGHYELKMQKDGNLVIYRDGGAIWATGTNEGKCKHWTGGTRCTNLRAIMQGDGNFVIYAFINWSQHSTALWATGTDDGNHPPSYLILLNNGKIQLHRGASPEEDEGLIWQN